MKRFLSFLLCFALVLSLAPAAVFADEAAGEQGEDYSSGIVSEEAVLNGAEPTQTNTDQLTLIDGEGDIVAPTQAGAAPEDVDASEDTDAPEDADALDETGGGEDSEETVFVYEDATNPVYKNVDFSALEQTAELQASGWKLRAAVYEAAPYNSVSQAAAYLRSQMVSRSRTISFQLKNTDSAFPSMTTENKKIYVTNLANEIFASALAHTGVSTEGDALIYVWGTRSGSYGYTAATSTFNFEYTFTYYTDASKESALTSKVNNILTGLSLTGKSDFEKIRAIYAYICDNVAYDNANLRDDTYYLKYTAYAAAINGTAVCQGIAVLFYRLALECGIDTRVIDGNTGNHAWNIVELNDKYYYLDATWDEEYTQNTWVWFLQCPTSFLRNTGHTPDGDNALEFLSSYTMSATDYIGSKTLTLDLNGIDVGKTGGVVYVDGAAYTPNGGTVTLPDVTAKSAVVYYFNNSSAADRHTVYPTNMYVWMLKYQNGAYTATRISAFDNIMQYAGSSIRLTGNRGIRMITSIPKTLKTALTSTNGSNGYTLLEYGTVLAWASELGSSPLVKGGAKVSGNYAYSKTAGTDPIFKSTDSLVQFTNVLTFTDNAKCVPDLALRPYMILEDANGVQVTLYGGMIYRNIGYIAYQNRAVFSAGTDAYNYINNIMNYVYPSGYTPYTA